MPPSDEYESDGYLHLPPDLLERLPFMARYNGKRIRFATEPMRARVYERDGGVCHYCGAAVSLRSFQADHKVPFSKGGLTVFTNLLCSCRLCNLAKGDSDYEVFVAELAAKGLEWRNRVAQQQANWFDYQNRLAHGQA